MITKDNLVSYICESAMILLSGSAALTLFVGFNILHVPIGVVGQLIYICVEYFRATKSNKFIKAKPIKYWVVAIFLGGVASYLGTGVLAAKTGLNELIIGISLGYFAQSIPEISDIVLQLVKDLIKRKFGSDEKDNG